MKMLIFPFENEIDFTRNCVYTLVIENQKLFVNIVETLNCLENSAVGKENIILVENEIEVDFSKNAMCIFDIMNFDFNNRKILTYLYQYIDKIHKQDEDVAYEYENLQFQLYKNVNEIVSEIPFSISIKENFGVLDYLKAAGCKINLQEIITFNDKMNLLIDLASDILTVKLLILVNCKCYYDDEELEEIYKYANYKKINLLFVEHYDRIEVGNLEKKLVIDKEYDEILK